MSWLEDAWDSIVEGFEYFISFEWLSDAWDFITGMFTDLGEFSFAGLLGGALGLGFILLTDKWMLKPFADNMSAVSGVLISGAVYALSFILGYLWFKQVADS